jgi:hypothetical protein
MKVVSMKQRKRKQIPTTTYARVVMREVMLSVVTAAQEFGTSTAPMMKLERKLRRKSGIVKYAWITLQ